MRSEPHPISGFLYQDLGDGVVKVEHPTNGKQGLFRWDGTWLEGDVTHADKHLLGYIGGPDLPPELDIVWTRLPVEGASESAQTGPVVVSGGRAMGRLPDDYPRTVAKYQPDPGIQTDEGARPSSFIEIDFFLDNDRKPDAVPDVYRLTSPAPGGPERISTARYIDPTYHDLEIERIWKKVWQVACHVDQIPNVGDYHIYTIANLSWIIVRTDTNEFKAHQNVCLHRGRILRDHDGKSAAEFRCPYHGWSWKIDGGVKEMTCEWDFAGVREDVCQLPGATVDTWGGWVFINPDPECASLADFLGPVMIDHYADFDLDDRYIQANVSRPMDANWKLAMEPFMESWHVIATHPQLLLSGGDGSEGRFDVFGHFGRGGFIGNSGASPQRGITRTREQALAAYRMGADGAREYLRTIIGDEADRFSDAQLQDTAFNDLFPNFHPWGGFARINFRFRPLGNDTQKSMMDVMLLAPWPKDKPKPAPAAHRMLTADQSWCDAPELGTLARILDQDVGNIPAVQAGVNAKNPPYVWFSAYNEGKLRNFHHNYDRWMGLDGEDAE